MILIPDEKSISSLWDKEIDGPIVSICCATYNHEKYIEDTLKGFLMQKTNFPFEILIHDDASTDNTSEIIREYEAKYPNIIKPIYQKENQHSKGIKVSLTYNYSRAKGKFIALCEGDDYWTDEYKLQKQVDIMEKNNEIKLCVHATGVFNISNNNMESNKIRLNIGDKIISAPEIIIGGGQFGHTSSFMFRKEIINNPPNWFIEYPSGDTPLRLLAAHKGNVYYLDAEMSVYRKGVQGSWTNRMAQNQKFIRHWDKSIQMFDEYDKYTSYEYSQAIRRRKSIIAYTILDKIDHTSENKIEIKKYYSLLYGSEKVKYIVKSKFPSLFNVLKSIRG